MADPRVYKSNGSSWLPVVSKSFTEKLLTGVPALSGYGSDYGFLEEGTFTEGSSSDYSDNGDGTVDFTINSAGTAAITFLYRMPVELAFDENGERRHEVWAQSYFELQSAAASTDYRIAAGLLWTKSTDLPGSLSGPFCSRAVDSDYATAAAYTDKAVFASFIEDSSTSGNTRKETWRKIRTGAVSVTGANLSTSAMQPVLSQSGVAGYRVGGTFDLLLNQSVIGRLGAGAAANVGIESRDLNNTAETITDYEIPYVWIQLRSFGPAGDIVVRYYDTNAGFSDQSAGA